MGDVTLKEEELAIIGTYVKTHLNEWLGETNVIPFSKQINLIERITGVETEIKNLHEQLKLQLQFMEKRFDMMDKRFEQVDKRFESFDGRFNRITALITIGFITMATLISVYQFLA